MTNSKTVFRPADRIAQFKPYYFAGLNQKITQLRGKGVDVIRLDIGSPDLPPTHTIIESLVDDVLRPDAHGYSVNGGTPEYRQAAAAYYQHRFGVKLDPQAEVLGLIGSKEGLFNLSQVLINPGDVGLVPDPGYPVYSAGTLVAGGEVYPVPLCEENDYLPVLGTIPEGVLKRSKILWLNYPNNPTGAVAPISFFEEAVAFARKWDLLIAHDAPYVDICFDGYRAPSLMQVAGAKQVAVEFNSLSKAYNMGGWRLGMVVGNPEVIGYLHTYKSQMDTSTFKPLMDVGVVALTGDQSWLEQRNLVYKERRDIILDAITRCGLDVRTPPATIYVWVRLPGVGDSMAFCDRLLRDTGVSITPGVVYGNSGEGYARISLGLATDRIREGMHRFVQWMGQQNRT